MDEFIDIGTLNLAVSDEFPDLSGAAEGTKYTPAVYREGSSLCSGLPSSSKYLQTVLHEIDGSHPPEGHEKPASGIVITEEATDATAELTALMDHKIFLGGKKDTTPQTTEKLRQLIQTHAALDNKQDADAIYSAFSHLFEGSGPQSSALVGETAGIDPSMHLPPPDDAKEAQAMADKGIQLMSEAGFSSELQEDMRAAMQHVFLAHGGVASASTPLSPAASLATSEAPKQAVDAAKQVVKVIPASTTAQRPIVIAACQLHAIAGDIDANITQIESIVKDSKTANSFASTTPVDVFVFPELFLTGYHVGMTQIRALALPLPSSEDLKAALSQRDDTTARLQHNSTTEFHQEASTRATNGGTETLSCHTDGVPSETTDPVALNPLLRIAQVAAAHNTAIAISYAEVVNDMTDCLNPAPGLPPIYNAFTVFDSDGSIAAHYRKTHLWGCAYEKAVFTPGPGPMLPAHVRNATGAAGAEGDGVATAHNADTHTKTPYSWCPYQPFTLQNLPDVKLGLLVCFDMEFPETVRSLALSGVQCVLTNLGAGDGFGMMSRKIAPTRAAENQVAFVFCNYPSEPLPEETVAADGRRVYSKPMAEDAITVAYSGGTSIFAPDGSALHSLPVYTCNRAKAPSDVVSQPVSSSYYRELDSTYITKQLRARTNASAKAANGVNGSGGDSSVDVVRDAAVVVVEFDPNAATYQRNAERNPYFADRRPQLYRT